MALSPFLIQLLWFLGYFITPASVGEKRKTSFKKANTKKILSVYLSDSIAFFPAENPSPITFFYWD